MSNTKSMDEKLALGLGLFSLGLGLWELFTPRRFARTTGMEENDDLVRFCGAREIAAGIGILSQPTRPLWMQSRVAGDVMDLAILGAAFVSSKSDRRRLLGATAAVAGVTALDIYCCRRLAERAENQPRSIHVSKSVIVDRPAAELYAFWSRIERLAEIMNHVESIETTAERKSHWKVKGPAGMSLEWDAEIIDQTPNEAIAWRTTDGGDVDHAGVVRFEPASGGRGTLVRVELHYAPPAGVLGAKVAKLFGEAPEQQFNVDLRRFKQLMETGEMARTEGQPAGRARSTSRKYDDFVRS